jgi:hypothetical protein
MTASAKLLALAMATMMSIIGFLSIIFGFMMGGDSSSSSWTTIVLLQRQFSFLPRRQQEMVSRRRLEQHQQQDSSSEANNKFRMLYIVTSSSLTYGDNQDRWTDRIVPVILDSVESFLELPNVSVDVYLVLGYTLEEKRLTQLRTALSLLLPHDHDHDGVGLEVWDDAIPMDYACSKFENEPAGTGVGGCHTKLNQRG